MKNLLYLFCVILLNSCASDADKDNTSSKSDIAEELSWNFSDQNFKYTIIYDTVAYPGDATHFSNVVQRVEIIKDGKIVQSIHPEKLMVDKYLDSSYLFIVEDVNFDGHNDIRIINWLSTRSDKMYDFWIFNEKTALFEQDTSINEIFNPSFDHKNKTMYTYWRIGVNEEGHAIYNWQKGKINLLIEEIMSVGPDPSIPPSIYTRKLIDGAFKCKWEDAPEFVQIDKSEIHAMLNSTIINGRFSKCDEE